MVIALLDQVVGFFIDKTLHRWAKQAQERYPASNRYTLRANTYSQAFASGKTIFFTLLAIVVTVGIIGFNQMSVRIP